MKRAQSVEVLSVLQPEATKRPPVLPHTFFEAGQESGAPPSESPPPLPPREKGEVGTPPPVRAVLNSCPQLVNDAIIIADRSGPPAIPKHPKPSPAASTASTAAVVKPKQHLNAKKTNQSSSSNRPSAGVLFGIKDKELPAPDTVRETRKLFEGNGGGGGRRHGGRSGSLTKSKSTSSLYTRPASRSNSLEKPQGGPGRGRKGEDSLHRAAVTQQARAAGSPVRKTRGPRVSSPRGSGRAGASSPARRPGFTPAPRTASSPSRSSRTRSPQARKVGGGLGSPGPARPALPAKPSHLSPIVNGKGPSFNSNILDRHVNKVTPSKVANSQKYIKIANNAGDTSGLVKASLANVIPSEPPSEINGKISTSSKPVDFSLPPKRISAEIGKSEEGTKTISQTSIQNIRNDGNVSNYVFDDKSPTIKSYLPGSPPDLKSSQPKQASSSISLVFPAQQV